MNDKRKVLGRGLDTLIPAARAVTTTQPVSAPGEMIRQLPVEQIDRNPYQTRSRFDETALAELAESIKASGVVQPILVRPQLNGRFQLIAGERRLLASQRAGKTTVPAIVKQVSNEQAMEMTIVENLQREDLNPIEQARAYERLGREFGLTQEQMAQRTGKERSSVANFLRLLKLPSEVQTLVEENKLSFGHAKALMSLDSPEAVLKLANRAVALSMSVRQVEGTVHSLVHPEPEAGKSRAPGRSQCARGRASTAEGTRSSRADYRQQGQGKDRHRIQIPGRL